MRLSKIVVGVDDSEQSRAALRWAAVEAALRDVELLVLHVYEWRAIGSPAPIGGPFAAEARAHAEAVVESALVEARQVAPGVEGRGEAIVGAPGWVLTRASGADSLVVLGNRGRGGFASLLLGSVSQQVATHAAGPVAVVRGRSGNADGPVVVGVDGSTPSDAALGMAFEAAEARQTGLVAVRAYSLAPPPWGPEAVPFVEDYDRRRAEEHQTLADYLVPWKDKFPGVGVEARVMVGHAAEVLADMSVTAQLVVVGTRGHGGFAGLLLGSVGLQLLHHAECPVLVVRAG